MLSAEHLRRLPREAIVILLVMMLLAFNSTETFAQDDDLSDADSVATLAYYDHLVALYGETAMLDAKMYVDMVIIDGETEPIVPPLPTDIPLTPVPVETPEDEEADVTMTPPGREVAPEGPSYDFGTLDVTVTPSPEIQGGHLFEIVQARRYLAATEPASIEIARQIDFRPRDVYEHPSNMCGSLSAQILFDAGFLTDDMFDGGFNPADFWLADPGRLNHLFPADQFTGYNFIDTGVNAGQFDFGAFPLLPGDFVYLIGGNYDHMLAVSKVEVMPDGSSRAYAVTNVYTETGFQIQERMLYDTAAPDAGLFDTYQNPNSWEGWTGARGLMIVRRDGTNLEEMYTGSPDHD